MDTPAAIGIEGDRKAGLGYLPEARQLLVKLKNQMRPGGLQTLRAWQRLSDDAYCVAIVAKGIAAVRIVAPPTRPEETAVSAVPLDWKTPDFLSGVVIGGRLIRDGQGLAWCDKFWPTPDCARLYFLNARNAPIASDPAPSRRLGVAPDYGVVSGFSEEEVTQYAVLKPTMWSGRMRQCVQALMGFGIPNRRSIYSLKDWRETEPGKPHRKDRPSPYEKRVAALGRQIHYDYRFYRTHGLTQGADGAWWLVEIGALRGIVAMPLPLYEQTQPDDGTGSPELREARLKFAQTLRKMNDAAAVLLVQTFGGFPTGEAFPPAGEEFDAWVRAGRVLRLRTKEEMQPFYDHSAYSGELGWGFNRSGSEAHLTGWRYREDGMRESSHYAVVLNFGARRAPVREAAAVQATVQQLLGLGKKYPHQVPAAIWKLRHLSTDQWNDLPAVPDVGIEAFFLALDALVVEPLGVASAALSLVERGPLFWPGRSIKNIPQFRVPNSYLKCLETFDLRCDLDKSLPPAVNCDTPVHVFFQNKSLHVVRYFYRADQGSTSHSDDFEDCMLEGSWSSRDETGGVNIRPQFYTSVLDAREEQAGERRTTHIEGKSLGYTSVTMADDPTDLRFGAVNRTKSFLIHTLTEVFSGPSHRGGSVSVPFFDREAYYFAKGEGCGSYNKIETWSYAAVGDPYSGVYFRRLWGGDRIPECGDSSYRRIYEVNYGPRGCSDHADSGPWLQKCDRAEDLVYSVELPGLPITLTASHPDYDLEVYLVSGEAEEPELLYRKHSEEADFNFDLWFKTTPDPETDWTAYLETTRNVLGENDRVEYYREQNGGPKFKGSPVHPAMEGKSVCFVGVNS